MNGNAYNRFKQSPPNFVSTYKILWCDFTVNLQVVAYTINIMRYFGNLL